MIDKNWLGLQYLRYRLQNLEDWEPAWFGLIATCSIRSFGFWVLLSLKELRYPCTVSTYFQSTGACFNHYPTMFSSSLRWTAINLGLWIWFMGGCCKDLALMKASFCITFKLLTRKCIFCYLLCYFSWSAFDDEESTPPVTSLIETTVGVARFSFLFVMAANLFKVFFQFGVLISSWVWGLGQFGDGFWMKTAFLADGSIPC